jgi:hypothetical protein
LSRKFNNVNELAKNASTTLLFTTTSFRMINFYWNRTRYVNMIRALDEGLSNAIKYGDRATKAIIVDRVRYMKRLTKVFWVIALVTANGMCIKAAIEALIYHHQISNNAMVRESTH